MNKKDKPKEKGISFLKIVYFDEEAAQDYLDIFNGGRKETTNTETKRKAREIVASLEGKFGGGIDVLQYLRAALSTGASGKLSGEVNQVLVNCYKNTLLTDYIRLISLGDCDSIKVFNKSKVYAKENSVSMYKSFASYLNIIPKDQLPIDMQKLNEAILGERGYYEMLLTEGETKRVLRFNLLAFRNNYTLADLPKMELSFYGIKVGKCSERQLEIGSEFTSISKIEPTAEAIIDGKATNDVELDIYDIVLAGIQK